MTDRTLDKNRIAFIDISIFDDGSIRGGVLITDTFSRPYEFRVTSPINPTPLQKILYGKTLFDYVYGELITIPLLKQVKEQVSLALSRDEHILVARPGLHFPLITLKTVAQGRETDSIEGFTVLTNKNYQGEKAQAEVILNELTNNMNIFEPFERVRLAVSEVHRQKIN